jgi:hypothetical protein
MEHDRDRIAAGYLSRLVAGLVACGVVAATLHADAAAVTILAAVMLVVLPLACFMLRDSAL